MDPVESGLACGSDTAHMSLFGYDPRKFVVLNMIFKTKTKNKITKIMKILSRKRCL